MSGVITQVQAGPPIDVVEQLPEMFYLDLRGQKFRLSRDTLLGLPESIIYSLSGNFAYPEIPMVPHPQSEQQEHVNHSNDSFYQSPRDDGFDLTPVDFNPKLLSYVLNSYHNIADGLEPPILPLANFPEFSGFLEAHHAPYADNPDSSVPELVLEPQLLMDPEQIPRILEERPGIIVLKEDIEYYCLASGVAYSDLQRIKTETGIHIESQMSIFDELLSSRDIIRPRIAPQHSGSTQKEPDGDEISPERHLVEMLQLAGVDKDSDWDIREREPHKTVVTSLQLSPLKLPEQGDLKAIEAVQKLLLFWKKPARKCWWAQFDMKLKDGSTVTVYMRKVWTLELTILGLSI